MWQIRKLRLNFYIGIDYSYIKEYMQKCRICVNILICVNKHDRVQNGKFGEVYL